MRLQPFYSNGGSGIFPMEILTTLEYKVFRLPKTLFIQGVCFYCTGSLLVGGIAPTNTKNKHLSRYQGEIFYRNFFFDKLSLT